MNDDPMMDVTPYTLSDQLVANDLLDGPIIVKILSIAEEPKADKPVVIEIDSVYPPWRPCKTSRRLMMGGWGKNMFHWLGKSVKLYRDPTVTYGTEEVGGVQIEQMSHMPETLVRKLIVGRNNATRLFTIPVLVTMEYTLLSAGLGIGDLNRWLASVGKSPWSATEHPKLAAYLARDPARLDPIRALISKVPEAEPEEVLGQEAPTSLATLHEAIEILTGKLDKATGDKSVAVNLAGEFSIDLSGPGGLRGIVDEVTLGHYLSALAGLTKE